MDRCTAESLGRPCLPLDFFFAPSQELASAHEMRQRLQRDLHQQQEKLQPLLLQTRQQEAALEEAAAQRKGLAAAAEEWKQNYQKMIKRLQDVRPLLRACTDEFRVFNPRMLPVEVLSLEVLHSDQRSKAKVASRPGSARRGLRGFGYGANAETVMESFSSRVVSRQRCLGQTTSGQPSLQLPSLT